MGLLELFITACVPVLNMLLVTGVGSFLASDFTGILGKEARKHLNFVVHACQYPLRFYLRINLRLDRGKSHWSPAQVKRPYFGLLFCWQSWKYFPDNHSSSLQREGKPVRRS